MLPDAYCIHRTFDAAGPTVFCMDRHYFLYALEGTLCLEADGRRWMLPPARAALIEAEHPVTISINARLVSASVLFDSSMFKPPRPLAVFDISPLARELVRECRNWGPGEESQAPYARAIFGTLASVICRLAEKPSPCVMPVPASRTLKAALEMTERSASGKPDFEAIARAVGQSPRSLSRRFSEEMGMTWREALQRIRIFRSVELLASGNAPITEIALQVGYTSLSAYNAAFRELTGLSPSRYRNSFKDETLKLPTA